MTAVTIRSREGASYLGIESTYGTRSGALQRVFPIGDVKLGLVRQEHVIEDESVYLGDFKGYVHGRKSATASFGLYLKPAAAQLTAAGAAVTPPGAHIIKAMMGGEAAAAGSTVAVGTSASTFDVAAGHGARFPVGTVIAVEIAGQLEVTRVATVATDTLGVLPSLSGAPGVGAKVINSYTYYITDDNTQSFTFQHAKKGSTSWQYELLAGIADLEIKTDRDALIQLVANCKFSDWNDGALGLADTWAADTQANPIPVVQGFTLLQGHNDTTRVQYPLHALAGKIECGMDVVPQLAGGVQGTVGVKRMKGRPSATAQVTVRADRDQMAIWDSSATAMVQVGAFSGSGTTARGIVLTFPHVEMAGRPEEDSSTGLVLTKLSFAAKLNASGATDLARAGVLVSLF